MVERMNKAHITPIKAMLENDVRSKYTLPLSQIDARLEATAETIVNLRSDLVNRIGRGVGTF